VSRFHVKVRKARQAVADCGWFRRVRKLELSSRAIFSSRNAPSMRRTNPGPSLALTAQARLGLALGMTMKVAEGALQRSVRVEPGL